MRQVYSAALCYIYFWGRRGRDRLVIGFITTCATVSITTKVVNSNRVQSEVYSIQYYVLKFVSDLIQHYVLKFVSDLIQHYVLKFVSDLIQHYVIKFVSDLRQVRGFLWISSTNKTVRHDIAEILLKMALNTINQPNQPV